MIDITEFVLTEPHRCANEAQPLAHPRRRGVHLRNVFILQTLHISGLLNKLVRIVGESSCQKNPVRYHPVVQVWAPRFNKGSIFELLEIFSSARKMICIFCAAL